MRIVIVGAGVIGLSTAIALREAGYSQVTIVTSETTPNTTSDIAAAIWTPYKVAPQQLADRLALETFVKLNEIIQLDNEKETGVYNISGYRYDSDINKPSFIEGKEDLFQYRLCKHDDKQAFSNPVVTSEYSHAHCFVVPMVDTSIYMQYLTQLFTKKYNGTIIKKHLKSIQDITTDYDLIINCAGFGSRQLFNDKNVLAIEGQISLCQLPIVNNVTKSDALNRQFYWSFHKHDAGSTYILPRLNNIYVLGGTAVSLSDEVMDANNPYVCPNTAQDIIQRCKTLIPDPSVLDKGTIATKKTGWRPYRKNGIRLELSMEMKNVPVIHSYGYGGAGITLSWGAANDAVRLVENFKKQKMLASKL
jgi:D-amino-acid oxidase